MLNTFLSEFEKFEVIILVTVFIALVIQIAIGYYQEQIVVKTYSSEFENIIEKKICLLSNSKNLNLIKIS